jgi:hypothetical protein
MTLLPGASVTALVYVPPTSTLRIFYRAKGGVPALRTTGDWKTTARAAEGNLPPSIVVQFGTRTGWQRLALSATAETVIGSAQFERPRS